MNFMGVFMAILVGLLVTACGNNNSSNQNFPASAQQPAGTQTFTVKGVIKKIEPAEKSVVIQHEEIPDYMRAMTMPFNVKNASDLEPLQPGDAITFRLNVTEDESWIDQIQKTGATQQDQPPSRPPVRIVRNVEPLEVGDLMPDYRFTNQLGQAVSFSNFKGHALAFTFIFTRCPIPDFCPRMSKNFAAACKILESNPSAPTNWHMFSISFDPHFDTPAVLKSYAERYNYTPEHWSFVTGAMIDIDAITEQFNLGVAKQGENWEHKLRTVVVDATGHIQDIFIGNSWTPDELAAAISKAARPEAVSQSP